MVLYRLDDEIGIARKIKSIEASASMRLRVRWALFFLGRL
jgi:hypothetical protein